MAGEECTQVLEKERIRLLNYIIEQSQVFCSEAKEKKKASRNIVRENRTERESNQKGVEAINI